MHKWTLMIALLCTQPSWAATIEYKTIEQCQQAMEGYIKEAESLPFEKSLAFSSWFYAFERNTSSMKKDCTNNRCITTYNLGGCGTISDSTKTLYSLVKPQLRMEINRLQQRTSSLPTPKLQIVCSHEKTQPPIKSGQCKLSQP